MPTRIQPVGHFPGQFNAFCFLPPCLRATSFNHFVKIPIGCSLAGGLHYLVQTQVEMTKVDAGLSYRTKRLRT